MAIHTDTNGLLTYNPNGSPSLPGGDANYLSKELGKAANAINKLVAIVKTLEARMNTNGLT